MNKIHTMLLGLAAISFSAVADDDDTGSPEQKAAAQAIIQAYGYTCDTVDAVFVNSRYASVICNGRYNFKIRDHGGRVSVEVND